MDDSVYSEIPDEPELAFLYLERAFYIDLQYKLEEYYDRNNGFPGEIYNEYVSKTLAARSELDLDTLVDWELPAQITEGIFQNFRRDVVHYRTAMQIRFGRRTKHFSVRLDTKAKRTIHHHITQIREFLQTLDIEDRKRERLLDKLLAFEGEVDRDRTRYESFGAAIIEFAGVMGQAGEKAESARKWLDSIAKLIWGAKDEELRELPAPLERKRIEPPKKEAPTHPELDDEIPF